ncbi:MAG: aromatic ring-hydroxylating dioxygenase subunit alpha [Hyphomicrobiaceae bacterium]
MGEQKAVAALEGAPMATHALEPHYYTDPVIWRRELATLLANTWQFAVHASAIPNTGDYATLRIAGEDLFAIRGKAGEIRTFYNVCQHRAHQLVSGTGNAKLVSCPYHAWTYELDGRLRAAPNSASVPGFDRQAVCLSEVRTEVFCGFVFVNLDATAKPMSEWFPNVEAELRSYVSHIDRLKPIEWVEIPESCNWKVSVENYSECYHCSLNHPTFAKGVIDPQSYDIQPQGYCLRHTTKSANLDRMTYPIDMSVPHAGDYSSWFLWPMFSFQVYPGNTLNTYHWRADSHDRCTVWRGWYTIDGQENEAIRKLAKQDRATTVEEDIRIVESVQKGLRSRGYKPGPLVLDPKCGLNSEHSIAALNRWMREGVA